MRTDVILLSHGSRAPEARDYFIQLSGLVKTLTGWPEVEPAFMELCGPSLREAVDARVASGARRVVILPCFLHPGRHLMEDIPRLMAEAQALHPAVPLILAERIGTHPDLARLIGECVERALAEQDAHPDGRCPGCLKDGCSHQFLMPDLEGEAPAGTTAHPALHPQR
jgi:sirohydrochlorin ferrochelatase